MPRKNLRIDILTLFLNQQKKLDEFINSLLRNLIYTYAGVQRDLTPQINNIRLIIENNPDITVAQIKKTPEYIGLIDSVTNEVDDFSTYTKVELRTQTQGALALALVGLSEFYSFYDIKANIVQPDAMQFLLDYLRPDGELMKRIELWAPNAAEMVSKSILEGVGLGRNPRVIARDISNALGSGLTDALRTSRTVQLYSYREATRMNYLANSDVVKGWIWLAALDDRTCMSCLSMHGTVHPLSESLNDHHNGRCAMIPLVTGTEDIIKQSGEEWFSQLAEAAQVKQMGQGKYDAYTAGKFQFNQLSKEYANEVFGTMRSETPLKDLVNE